MSEYAWLALGIFCGWFLKTLQVRWYMQMLKEFTIQSLQEMRDECERRSA